MLTPTSFDKVMVGVTFHDVATMVIVGDGSDSTPVTIKSVLSSNPDTNVILSFTPTTFTAAGAYSDIFTNTVIDYIPTNQPTVSIETTTFNNVPTKLGSLYSYITDPRTDIIVTYTITFSDGTIQKITHDIEHNYDPNRLLLLQAVHNGDY